MKMRERFEGFFHSIWNYSHLLSYKYLLKLLNIYLFNVLLISNIKYLNTDYFTYLKH